VATIYKGGTRQITTNFNEAELYSGSFNAPDSHFLDDNVINAVQCLRNWSMSPIEIVSTFRTPEHNATLLGSATNSQHLIGRAIDFKWVNPEVHDVMMKRLREAMVCPDDPDNFIDSESIGNCLWNNQIRGIGFYETFMHIDTREPLDSSLAWWQLPMSIWDFTNGKYDPYKLTSKWYADSVEAGESTLCGTFTPPPSEKKTLIEKIINALLGGRDYDEDGVLAIPFNQIFIWFILIVLAIVGYQVFKK